MTRIFTDGGEMGDGLFWNAVPITGIVTHTTAIHGPHIRSGNFAYRSYGAVPYRYISPISSGYFRTSYWTDSVHTSSRLFSVRSGATELLSVRFTASKVVQLYVGATAIPSPIGSIVFQINTNYLIEVYFLISDSGGRVTVKVDGIVDLDYTGDTKTSTQTTVDSIGAGSAVTQHSLIDDLALNDTNGTVDNSWCGDGHVIAIIPNASGDVTQLTGSDGNSVDNFALIDEIPVGTAPDDYVESSVVDAYDLYQMSDLGFTGVDIQRVWVEARALDTVAAGGLCQLGIKTGGVEDWSNDISLLTSTTMIKGKDYKVKPDTTAWTIDEVNAIQTGFKAR